MSHRAVHVAFEIERAWCEDVAGALVGVARGDERALAEVLARWWSAREARLAAATVTLDDGTVVRTHVWARLQERAPRLERLEQLGAPAIILDRERAVCARLRAELDPAVARTPEPPPSIGTTPDAAGHEVVDLTAWFDAMLRAAHAGRADLGTGEIAAEADVDTTVPAPQVWPGMSTFAHLPALPLWTPPGPALPHRFEVPTEPPQLVVAESSGPVTYALDGAGARVSFVWLETEAAGPWRPAR